MVAAEDQYLNHLAKEYKINWIAMARQSNRWKNKLEQYINDMLISGEIRLMDSHFFYYKK